MELKKKKRKDTDVRPTAAKKKKNEGSLGAYTHTLATGMNFFSERNPGTRIERTGATNKKKKK